MPQIESTLTKVEEGAFRISSARVITLCDMGHKSLGRQHGRANQRKQALEKRLESEEQYPPEHYSPTQRELLEAELKLELIENSGEVLSWLSGSVTEEGGVLYLALSDILAIANGGIVPLHVRDIQ